MSNETNANPNAARIAEVVTLLGTTPATDPKFLELTKELATLQGVQPTSATRTKYTRLYQMPEYKALNLPTWVWRLQDLATWEMQQKAAAAGYNAKVSEVHRKDNGCVVVEFNQASMLWVAVMQPSDKHKKSAEYKLAAEAAKALDTKDAEAVKANKALRSSEKRQAIACARYLAALGKLAFVEKTDVKGPSDTSVLTSQKRRTEIYKPQL